MGKGKRERNYLWTRDRSFYKNFGELYWVLILQNVLILSVNLADNIMLGSYHETALAGVASVNQIQFVLQQLVVGCGDSLVVLGSQYWGRKQTAPVKQLYCTSQAAALFFAGSIFIAVTLFPRQALCLFTSDEAVIQQGMEYLVIIRFTYLIFAVTNVLLAALKSVESVRISFYVSLCTLGINCGMNYLLIFGNFGFPRLGARGAAIGTLIARTVELGIVLVYLLKIDKRLKMRIPADLKWNKVLARDYRKVCYPVILVSGLWGCSTALQTVILGHLQSSAIAANSIASTLFSVLKVASVGGASCATIIIGKTIGAGKFEKVKEYTKTLQLMFLGIGIITSIALFIIKGPILSFYNLTPETAYLANAFLTVLCVTCIGTAYQMPVLTGIIRGGGDTKFAMINDLISIWGVVLPISFLAAFYFKWSPVIVVCCLNSDQIFKCAAAFLRVNHYKWVRQLSRESEAGS